MGGGGGEGVDCYFRATPQREASVNCLPREMTGLKAPVNYVTNPPEPITFMYFK